MPRRGGELHKLASMVEFLPGNEPGTCHIAAEPTRFKESLYRWSEPGYKKIPGGFAEIRKDTEFPDGARATLDLAGR